jgi:GDP-4-dehydro-6-deoxy-D-mannose reductase
MRALITGVTGFAGSHLAECCAAHGAEVIGLGRRQLSDEDVPPGLSGYLAADLLDRGAAERVLHEAPPDIVFHLAAEASVARSWQDPAGAVLCNVSTALNLLESLRAVAPHAGVLIACSGEQYGAPEQLPVDERHVLRPRNPYSVGKAAVDLAAGFYADSCGMHVIRARAFNHAGPGQGAHYVVAGFARQIALAERDPQVRGQVELVTGNLAVRRDFTDVRDVVEAYWRLLERAAPGPYNVCSGRSVRVEELLAGLAEHTELAVSSRVDPALVREHEVMEIVGSHDKLTKATGWEPEIALERTLQDSLDWWRQRATAEVGA